MASCELDYRLSAKLQSSNSEEIEEDAESSDDEVSEHEQILMKMGTFFLGITGQFSALW